MSDTLAIATELLERHYRWLEIGEPDGSWKSACDLLLNRSRKSSTLKQGTLREGKQKALAREASPLENPEDVAAMSRAELHEILSQLKLPEKLTAALHGLARWWLENGSEGDPFLSRIDDEELRRSLRSIRGFSGEEADRLVTYVFGRKILPLNRPLIRIGCRHRWIGWDADDEEWQGLFRLALRDADATPAELSGWLNQVGRDYCGPTPQCELCPLREILPESGPDTPLE